ncbi:type I restriction endonuclease subunit R [Leptospira wolffii]|uniref:type I restriction endonuclease subunit R n=1 Tax=Leptospira wolffii TaxID=409998 RepID=UPI0002D516DA|nr:HsdR family type I site-specific deoxyribonuclease [Leptospira wolffii]EPG66856.1 type I site-specific deoxyribonuclease, HsdR family [Leptospira wolffii serovar Khorat str. Khorat-H2]
MSQISVSERVTQNRIIQLFQKQLGYKYLGNWEAREGNSNIEEEYLSAWLKKRGIPEQKINSAIYGFRTEANHSNRDLYHNNMAVFSLLVHGVTIKLDAAENAETIHLIDWDDPDQNEFAIAEEVTLLGVAERRPDLVLYINGIAVAVIELKRGSVNLSNGIGQLISNQSKEFNAWFFSTVQFVFAGNDSEGMRYGTIGTEAKNFLIWKEDELDNDLLKLDKYLIKICKRNRFLDLMQNFVLFDGGKKKVPRVHQYFAIKAAQKNVKARAGGIIWHTQGSGKSTVMVYLARWILTNNPKARVAVITDRDELDKQIEGVFRQVGESIHKAKSGKDLMLQLGKPSPRLLCSLIHKFGNKETEDFEQLIRDLESEPAKTYGEIFVFVDECHRTQSGKLHRLMRAIMPNAVFIGFTGTPLLKKDAATTLEVFGKYIHTYKFNEAVEDQVILDLVYEARDVDQHLTSKEKTDEWFEASSKGLNKYQQDELKHSWGTMQKLLSSKSRMERIIGDIMLDFKTRPRLSSDRGNAILVASSIYEACKYYSLLQGTPFKNQCAVITSYNPKTRDISEDDMGANTKTDKEFIYDTYEKILDNIVSKPAKTKAETYEDMARNMFVDEPAKMKLLVVVDKLLTGFDAPACTFLYIDKSMQDHGLFQAICRTNRLDGDDKQFGYVVDYKDLFKKVENAIAVYTSELDNSFDGTSSAILLKDRIANAKEKLEEAREAYALLCEPVRPPRAYLDFQHYFCGNTEIPSDLEERELQRFQLYKATAVLVRCYSNLSNDLDRAGYTPKEIEKVKVEVKDAVELRDKIRMASGEYLDLKPYEADMRHLIDTYIQADEPRNISPFGEIGLLDLIIKSGIAKAIFDQLGKFKGDMESIAETIENNVRRKIIKEHLNDPNFYDKMSELLTEIIADRKAKAIDYEQYLKRIAELIKNLDSGKTADTPKTLNTKGKLALYHNLNQNESLALQIDAKILSIRPDDWRGILPREQIIKKGLFEILGSEEEVERIFPIVKQHSEY